MDDEYLTKRFAEIEVSIEMLEDRLDTMDMVVSWLLSRQPDDAGYRFLCGQANVTEEEGRSPGVVAELDILRGLVSSLRDSISPGRSLPS